MGESKEGLGLLLLPPCSNGAAARVSLGPFSLHDGELGPKVFGGRGRKPAAVKLTPDGAPRQCPFKKHIL